MRSWLERLATVGVLPTDSDAERARKATLTLTPLIIVPLAAIWVVTYWALNLRLAAAIPLAYQVFSTASLLFFFRTKRYRFFRFTQLLLMLLLPFALQLTLGGFVASSGVILWSLFAPLGALMFSGPRQAVRWLVAFLLLTGVSAVLEPFLPDRAIPREVVVVFFALNFGAVSGVIYVLFEYFVRERERAQELSEALLLNVLPESIAKRLKRDEGVIADRFDDATVLFADIADFTAMATASRPNRSSASSTRCSLPSTSWPSDTGSRRSRPSGMPTWSPVGSRSRDRTTPRRSPTWRSRCRRPVVGWGRKARSTYGSVSIPGRWSPG